MQIKFNTGRQYTAEGQVIVVETQEDGTILFADLSRGIDGRIASPTSGGPLSTTEADLRAYVLWMYDRNMYDGCRESMLFAARARG